jgi:branched-chain amino acid transport system ATP-binding protein
MSHPLLRLSSVSADYGALSALKAVSLHVNEGELVALLGANGAGKSSTLNCISGLLPPRSGQVVFDGQTLNGWAPDRVVRAGVTQVPEGRQVFGSMTVLENLLLGAYTRFQRRERREIELDLQTMWDLFPILADRRTQRAGSFSGGEQQMLAIARALMARPRMLLLDEPSMGLAPVLVREIFETIVRLRARGTTVLLVEQNALAALRVADRAYVLESGRIVLEGTAEELMRDREVRRAYLGKDYEEV